MLLILRVYESYIIFGLLTEWQLKGVQKNRADLAFLIFVNLEGVLIPWNGKHLV